jgi:thiol:disulfide interchange protein DsbD
MGVGTELQDKEGYTGSFFTGILASVVASPCTAPFMGAALGFAFTQTASIALTVFVALGLGMALPFLLVSFNPTLSKLLPHPGKWMLTFKQILAFPLYATAVWLLWVLGNQTGTDGMALVIACCVLLAAAAWLYQRRHDIQSAFWRYANALIILLCLAVTIGVVRSPLLETQTIASGISEDAAYEAYSDARLAELRSNGQPVFVNMTASWCITCLVNEKVALNSEAVITALAENNITYLKGDWTNNDPEITEVLRRYETSGVPLYLMYPSDPSLPAEVLPQILTTGVVLDAIERI